MIRIAAQLIAKKMAVSGARNGAAISTIVVAPGFLVSSEDHG